MDTTTQQLVDPVGYLTAREETIDWDSTHTLAFNERYRTSQLPLVRAHASRSTRLAPLTTPVPGQTWPPVRCALFPLHDAQLAGEGQITAFLDDLRDSIVSPYVWWRGLEERRGLVHCNLHPRLDDRAAPAVPSHPLAATVLAPWMGRANPGRIYLPVSLNDPNGRDEVRRMRAESGAPQTPLLAGYVQLTDELDATTTRTLALLLRHHRDRIHIPVTLDRLWIVDTMDSLLLRSRLVEELHFGERTEPEAPA